MTTDITELALLVSKAKASVFTLKYISQFEPADIDSDDVDLRFEVDGVETGTNVSIIDECGQAANVIGALVDALEKAQHRNGELETYSKTAIEFREAARDESRHLKLELEIAEKRIAKLESRTVTVKLPNQTDFDDPLSAYEAIEKCKEALTAAGIKWEAE